MGSYEQRAEVISKLRDFNDRHKLISISVTVFYTKYKNIGNINRQVLHLDEMY